MKDIEKRISHVEELTRRMNDRLKNIIDSRTHYLRNKAKKNGHTMAKLRALVAKLERLEKVLGPAKLTIEERGEARAAIMFTAYERQKLRKMLAPDHRHVYRCSAADAETLQQIISQHRAG